MQEQQYLTSWPNVLNTNLCVDSLVLVSLSIYFMLDSTLLHTAMPYIQNKQKPQVLFIYTFECVVGDCYANGLSVRHWWKDFIFHKLD